jgi:hypothetical protein
MCIEDIPRLSNIRMVVSHYVIENITLMSTPRFFLADPLARFETYQTNPDWMLSMTGSMLEKSEKKQNRLK